ncbi:hypothetical protein GJ744_005039 [Endocarpon pusillum]|uniref:Uncharacterized protein n=1 Tax=Endocarpon pusillum TaxID=364733 RepID=A0A8H7A7Y2_9EURO|nr:hypothetical protein GJ744_005039 [Endocarpon pusillum]
MGSPLATQFLFRLSISLPSFGNSGIPPVNRLIIMQIETSTMTNHSEASQGRTRPFPVPFSSVNEEQAAAAKPRSLTSLRYPSKANPPNKQSRSTYRCLKAR